MAWQSLFHSRIVAVFSKVLGRDGSVVVLLNFCKACQLWPNEVVTMMVVGQLTFSQAHHQPHIIPPVSFALRQRLDSL